MVAIVIVTHGRLADSLLDTARLIVGDLPATAAVGLEPADGPEAALRKVETAIARIDEGDGVILLVDLPGGTPCTVCMACLSRVQAEVVSGVNLTTVVKVPFVRSEAGLTLAEKAVRLASYGSRAVRVITTSACEPCCKED